MEQKNINTKPGIDMPTVDMRIKAPIEIGSLCVAVGTKIMTHGFTFLCVEQEEPITSIGDDEHTHALCEGCAAPFSLCHIMRCESSQRPDGVNVQFKVIARHE